MKDEIQLEQPHDIEWFRKTLHEQQWMRGSIALIACFSFYQATHPPCPHEAWREYMFDAIFLLQLWTIDRLGQSFGFFNERLYQAKWKKVFDDLKELKQQAEIEMQAGATSSEVHPTKDAQGDPPNTKI